MQILASLDDNYCEESVMFMGVLNELAKAVVRWFPSCDKGDSNSGDNRDQALKVGMLCRCCRESESIAEKNEVEGNVAKAPGIGMKPSTAHKEPQEAERDNESESCVAMATDGNNVGDTGTTGGSGEKNIEVTTNMSMHCKSKDAPCCSNLKGDVVVNNNSDNLCNSGSAWSDITQKWKTRRKAASPDIDSILRMLANFSSCSDYGQGCLNYCCCCSESCENLSAQHRRRTVSENLAQYYSDLLRLEREAEGEMSEEELSSFE